MANIIAVIWDFDKTLINGYMQDPMFEEYGVNASEFWKENNALPSQYEKEYGIRVNADTMYLNQFIKYAREGKFHGLNNEKLKEFGKKQKFYPGIPEFFQESKALIENEPKYKEYGILVEHYITFTVRLILEIYRRNDSKISNKTETGLPFYLAPSQQSKNPGKLKNAKKNAPCTHS